MEVKLQLRTLKAEYTQWYQVEKEEWKIKLSRQETIKNKEYEESSKDTSDISK